MRKNLLTTAASILAFAGCASAVTEPSPAPEVPERRRSRDWGPDHELKVAYGRIVELRIKLAEAVQGRTLSEEEKDLIREYENLEMRRQRLNSRRKALEWREKQDGR